MSRVIELRQRKATLVDKAEQLLAKVDPVNGMAEADRNAYGEIQQEIEKVNIQLGNAEWVEEQRRQLGRVAHDNGINLDRDKLSGEAFASAGQFLQAVANAGMNKGQLTAIDPRLTWVAPSGNNEATPSEGGWLVQKDFSTRWLDMMHEMGELWSRVTRIPISANADGIKLPAVDETSRANGSRWGGVRAYWVNEADTVTASRPKFRQIELSLKKLMAICYATDEILRDAAVLERVMMQAFLEEMIFRTEDAIMNGDGSGKPLGWLNSPALVTVAAEGGQTADTVVTNNILKMYNRLPLRSKKNAVWIINSDIEPMLYALTLGSGTAVTLLYRPPGVEGNASTSGLGTLIGRPVIPVEYAATLGDLGDINLVDLSQYLMIEKEGLRADESMHVRFLYDEMTFRWTWRCDGQPAWKVPITPYKGVVTHSPYITLAAR